MDALVLFSWAESLIAKLASRACEEACQVLGVYQDLQQFTDSFIHQISAVGCRTKEGAACLCWL
ncbi:disease resistance protein RGA2-like [Trifolium medium]|uniref:Disease resistance protein RGA2-like n=1 Tax=Trifolium medium TaxID=97028 RepID=A0A392RIA0_9FABA|nr:disease resistance protein RGA2-like [Trifolium medium]